MKSPPFLAGLVLAWFVAAVPSASATKVAVLVPQLSPSVSAELRDRFHNALARGLDQGGAETLPAGDVRARLSANEELMSCTAGSCLVKIVSELKVDRLALPEINIAGKNYSFTLRLVDQKGIEMWQGTERCEICSVREADEAAAKAGAHLAPLVGRPGPTDLASQVKAPQQEMTAPKAETRPLVPMDRPPERGHMNGYRIGWIVSLSIGGALAVASVPLLYYASKDGQTTCDPSIARQNCPTVYHGNLGAGLGLLLGGVGAGLAGFGILYYLDRRYEKQRTAKVTRLGIAPAIGGAVMSLEGRF